MARTMLKPDSTRYPSVVQTRISGPEWIEPDSAEPEGESNDALAFRGPEELPTGLALDLRLHEILQQACLITAASGAVIALAGGGKMVCRATLGDKSPSAGVCLNPRSGLSGACVQSREMQLCDDTLADPRVNAIACRDLGMRSIVVLPVLDGGELWGVLEVFSSVPRAFSDSDLQVLQSLSREISHTVQEAIEGGSAAPAPEAFSGPLATDSAPPEPAEYETLHEPEPPDTAIVRRDYRTGALTVAVLALAVLLGWMVGRVGWSMAVNRAPAQIPMTPEEAQTSAQVMPDTHSAPPRGEEPAVPAKPVDSTAAPPAAAKPAPKPKARAAEPIGSLVVYEHGKVVFRMAPPEKESPSAVQPGAKPSNSIQQAATRQDDPSAAPAQRSGSASSGSANGYLLERVEPEYPEAARQQRIQGPVVLDALIGSNGSVRELSVISGDPQLVKAATNAVRQWRFRPHQLEGKAVEFETRITVNFALPE